jgi:hypothetical protein
MNQLIKAQNIALSNIDIMRIVNNKANIILYPDLHKYKTIDQILGPYGATFILFEAKPNYGHWCLLFKTNPGTLEFFNPYNGLPDDSLEHISDDFRKRSKQDIPYLSLLMLESPYQLSYNEHQFQEHSKNIKTCGRHCCVRFLCRRMSLKKYYKFINEYCRALKITPDQFVTALTIK